MIIDLTKLCRHISTISEENIIDRMINSNFIVQINVHNFIGDESTFYFVDLVVAILQKTIQLQCCNYCHCFFLLYKCLSCALITKKYTKEDPQIFLSWLSILSKVICSNLESRIYIILSIQTK